MATVMMRARVVNALVLALQLLLLGVLPVADAIAESRSSSAISHVERFGGDDCAAAHQLEQCALCQVLRTPFSGAAQPPLCVRQKAQFTPRAATSWAVARSAWSRATPPRGPPVVERAGYETA